MVREAISTITSKNQTTVPKIVRQSLALKPGDKIKYIVNAGGLIRIVKVKGGADNMWDVAYEQEKKYGSFDTPEID